MTRIALEEFSESSESNKVVFGLEGPGSGDGDTSSRLSSELGVGVRMESTAVEDLPLLQPVGMASSRGKGEVAANGSFVSTELLAWAILSHLWSQRNRSSAPHKTTVSSVV